jgi:magnesium transporter
MKAARGAFGARSKLWRPAKETMTGSLLPFVLRKLGFDPASASAPFVATLVDVTGLVIYFTAASIILRGTLL